MIDIIIPVGTLLLLAILEAALGAYTNGKYKLKDWIVGLVAISQFTLLVRPLIVGAVALALTWAVPQYQNSLSEINFWYAIIGYLLIDDFLHYWLHRLAHKKDWLWKFHETHHISTDINTNVAFKTNFFWLFMLPELYFAGACLWLGVIWPLVVAHTFKGALEFFYHFNKRPDLILHQNKYLKPIGWVLERLIVLQDTHHAHHGCGSNGKHQSNYSGTLMIWDIVFGTAYFPHSSQEEIGIGSSEHPPWYQQLYWPLFKSSSYVDHTTSEFLQKSQIEQE